MARMTKEIRDKWAGYINAEPKSAATLTRNDIFTHMCENQLQWNKTNASMLKEASDGRTIDMGETLKKDLKESTAPTMVIGDPTGDGSGINTGPVYTWSPILIKMARRLAPNLMAMDFMGVQPMDGPDGQIFALRARYESSGNGTIGFDDAEAFVDEARTGFSGDGTTQSPDPAGFPKGHTYKDNEAGDPDQDIPDTAPAFGKGVAASVSQQWGTAGNDWAKMGITIEKSAVSAKTRGLFADYTNELRTDMMKVHGEDVDAILADVLTTEIGAEMNREFIRTLNLSAKFGRKGSGYLVANDGTLTPEKRDGILNITLDTDGRWALERWKNIHFRVELEANDIAKRTRRGKGNRILCSSNVASALMLTGMLDYAPAIQGTAAFNVDDTGQTFVGTLPSGARVYIDPYSISDYMTVSYKGTSELDAGIFYAPYVPLEMYRTVSEDGFNPRMGFKTRYGIVANPYEIKNADGTNKTGQGLGAQENSYATKTAIINLG